MSQDAAPKSLRQQVMDQIADLRMEVTSVPTEERERVQLALDLTEPLLLRYVIGFERGDDIKPIAIDVMGSMLNALISFAVTATQGNREVAEKLVRHILQMMTKNVPGAFAAPADFQSIRRVKLGS